MNAWDTLMYRETPLALSGRTKEEADRPDTAFGLRKAPALSAAHPFLPPLPWFHAKILLDLLTTQDTKSACVAEQEIKSGHLIYSLSLFLRQNHSTERKNSHNKPHFNSVPKNKQTSPIPSKKGIEHTPVHCRWWQIYSTTANWTLAGWPWNTV